MGEVEVAARALGLKSPRLRYGEPGILAPLSRPTNGQADALYVVVDALVAANRTRIITFALAARLPAILILVLTVEAGGLMSYGPNFPDLYRRTAEYVDRILRGTNRPTCRSNNRPI